MTMHDYLPLFVAEADIKVKKCLLNAGVITKQEFDTYSIERMKKIKPIAEG